MASELIVQTLKGPTSGANANKIIVPSGQTLDIDTWSPPAGTLLQHVSSDNTSASSFTYDSTSYTNYISLNITPKFSNSVLFMGFNLFVYSPQNISAYARLTDGNGNSLSGHWSNWSSGGGLDAHIVGVWSYSPNTTTTQTIRVQVRTSGGSATFGAGRSETLWIQEIAG